MSHVQAVSVPHLLTRNADDVVLGAETGSGKTLAYSVPMVDRVLRRRASGGEEDEFPAQVVVVPTSVLCRQGADVLRQLTADLPVRSGALVGQEQYQRFHKWDIVVTTLTCLLRNLRFYDAELWRDRLSCAVLDECDLLLSAGRQADVMSLFHQLKPQRRSKPDCQMVLAGATIPDSGARSVSALIRRYLPDATWLTTPRFHHHKLNVQQEFVDVPDDESEAVDVLVDVIRATDGQTLVFVNTKDAADALLEQLCAADEAFRETAAVFHQQTASEDANNEGEHDRALTEFATGRKQVLISTDIAARGIDFGTAVQHVVQWQLATNVVSHLHRVGRTGRVLAQGRATNFVRARDAHLATILKSTSSSDEDVTTAFSRRRSLRRRARRQRRH